MARFPKQILFQDEARENLLKGINIACDAITQTLGPKAANVAINQAYGAPKILHDGVSIANEIDLQNPFQDMGAQLVKEACGKTVSRAGDGTTLTACLTKAIVNEGDQLIKSGKNAQTLKSELETELDNIRTHLDKLTKKVTTNEEIENVATVSSANPTIGKMIAQAYEKVGTDGIVTSEIGNEFETKLVFKQGMEFDRGYISPNFITNEKRAEAITEKPYILITDKRFGFTSELLPFMENFMKWETENKNLVMICGDLNEESLAMTVINHLNPQSSFRCVAIKAPAFGEHKTRELEDIAALTGGAAILEETGRGVESIMLEELGRAEKVTSNVDITTISGGYGNKEAIEKRASDIREQIEHASTKWNKDALIRRLAKLVGGEAQIIVGATTEPETLDLNERVIDAIHSAKAAISDGIVAGGEITFLELAKKTKHPIFKKAFKAPFQKLLENAGIEYVEAVKKLTGKRYPWGIDVMDGHRKDMLKAGIVDPYKVCLSALENAVSVSNAALITNVLISEPLDDRKI